MQSLKKSQGRTEMQPNKEEGPGEVRLDAYSVNLNLKIQRDFCPHIA